MGKLTTTLLLALMAACECVAEPCVDNFTSTGSFLSGQTYKTSALLSGVSPQDAFARAYAFTLETGFTVTSANKEAGVIVASQTVSVGTNRSTPLTISLQSDSAGTMAVISYATLVGQFSPSDAIQRHFCATLAAASRSTRSAHPTPSPTGAVPMAVTLPVTPRGFANISGMQQAAITQELSKKVAGPLLQEAIDDAAPTVARLVQRMSCWTSSEGANVFNEFAAPGVDLGILYPAKRPTLKTPYHSPTACLTVLRIQGWRAPANNALQFEVVYKADDSGESAKTWHELVRQPVGAWLVTQ